MTIFFSPLSLSSHIFIPWFYVLFSFNSIHFIWYSFYCNNIKINFAMMLWTLVPKKRTKLQNRKETVDYKYIQRTNQYAACIAAQWLCDVNVHWVVNTLTARRTSKINQRCWKRNGPRSRFDDRKNKIISAFETSCCILMCVCVCMRVLILVYCTRFVHFQCYRHWLK